MTHSFVRPSSPSRRPWTEPSLVALPPLEQLTLQTGSITADCTITSGCTFSYVPRMDGSQNLPG